MTLASVLVLAVTLSSTLAGGSGPQTPARSTAGVDACVLAGTVLDGSTRQPISRAIVEIAGTGLETPRFVVTDTTGKFELDGLSAGRFSLTATRPGYMAGYFGSARAGRGPAEPVTLSSGQRRTDLVVTLQRGGVIAGRITGANGGQSDVMVSLLRAGRPGSPPIAVSKTQTDDQGDYRFFGLADGRYFVVALPGFPLNLDGARLMSAPGEGAVGFAPIVYPSAASIDDAEAIDLGAGEARESIDMQMQFVHTAHLSGTVTPSGVWTGPLELGLVSAKQSFGFTGFNAYVPIPVSADGRFTRSALAPGHYQLSLRGRAPASAGSNASSQVLWAQADVDLNGVDVDGVDLHLRPAFTVRGRLRMAGDAGSNRPALQVKLTGVSASTGPAATQASADATGAFDLADVVPGVYRVNVSDNQTAAHWVVESGTYGASAATGPIAIADTPEPMTLIVARASAIRGRLLEADGNPAHGYSIVLIDAPAGTPATPRIARLGSDGSFEFGDLHAGKYWLGAVTGADDEDLADDAFVDAVRKTATAVEVGRGESKPILIRIGGGSGQP